MVGAAGLECREPAAEAGELIRRELDDGFGDFFDFHVTQYSTARAWLSGGKGSERAARLEAEAEAANAQADLSSTEALISHLKLEIEKLRRQLYGSRSERKARLLDQMELQLEELETAATEDELAAEKARPGHDGAIVPAQAAVA